ncbi:MAG TPA: hypothetical protein VFJ93_15320 [Gaiellaceae bacterium]|nr:hypothetical protein [Gaiellaceae bacterium]
MLRLITVICIAGALAAPAAIADAAPTGGPQDMLACWFFHGGSSGRATTSCIATTFAFREWVSFCRPNANSTTGFEGFNVPTYDVLETDSVYAGNATAGAADTSSGIPTYHRLKPQSHLIFSDATPDHLDDWNDAVDLGSCSPS